LELSVVSENGEGLRGEEALVDVGNGNRC
jgi:hypothetical protein